MLIGGLREHEVGSRTERFDRPTGSGVSGVHEPLAALVELDAHCRERMIGAGETHLRVEDRRVVAVAHEVPVERVGPAAYEPFERLLDTLGGVHGQTAAVDPVLVEHVQAVDVDAVIGMRMRDDDRGEVGRVRVLLQIRERAVPAVHPDDRIARAHEVAAARAARR